MRSSVHETPDSDPEWVVPPTPSMRTDFGNRLRTSRAPGNGVAASLVSAMSRMPPTFEPLTLTGLPGVASQSRHGALYQVLFHARNGCLAWIRQASRSHVRHFVGHCASLHCTA